MMKFIDSGEPELENKYQVYAFLLLDTWFFHIREVQDIFKVRTAEDTQRAVVDVLGYDSLTQIPPEQLMLWAASAGVDKFLCQQYIDIATERLHDEDDE